MSKPRQHGSLPGAARLEDRLSMAASAMSVAAIALTSLHEVKNGLSNIELSLHSIRDGLRTIAKPRDRRQLETDLDSVEDEIVQLNATIRGLHLLGQHRGVKERELLCLNIVAVDSLQLARPAFAGRRLRSTTALDPRLMHPGDFEEVAVVWGDAVQIRQLVLSLLLNAIDASPSRGLVRVETKDRGLQVELRVVDYGVGIEEEIRDQIFSPFFTTKHGAMGLGLYLCRRIAREHGGDISFSTQKNKGTTFSLILPKDVSPAKEVLR